MMLLVTKVPRNLDVKTRLFGFELVDLLLIFLYLSLSNVLFGGTRLKFLIVWVGTLAIGATVYLVKRKKPDRYLEHWGEFHRTPGVLSAGAPDTEYQPFFGPDQATSIITGNAR